MPIKIGIFLLLIVAVFGFFFWLGSPFNQSKSISQKSPEQQKQLAEPCNTLPLQRQFNNTPYYSGPLFDDHFHMPQMFKIPNNPDAPVLDKDVSSHSVICLFEKGRVEHSFAFYGIPINLKDQSVQSAKAIEEASPGTIIHFIELVSFPGYPVIPSNISSVLDSNKGLFKGYGEISLYLPHYTGSNVSPNDSQMKELYKIAQKQHLIVMMHLTQGQQQAFEEVLREFPNVTFLLHAAEDFSWSNTLFSTFFDKYPNLYYSIDMDLYKEAILQARTKQEFSSQMKSSWQNMLNQRVAFWKSKIEKYPDRFLWGTDRGHYGWHYDQDVTALIEEYSRTFIGQLDPAVQEKYAYKNAESLLQKR
ncbi:MAG: amidohydrolase family protein [Candidatus Daviesbacteria bacterium]|nr:amidohydrolase family protein [Candidatus Daviesbacteria bacterium]